MVKTTKFFLVFLLFLNLFSGATLYAKNVDGRINQVDKKGLKEGRWVVCRKSTDNTKNQKSEEGIYKDNLKEGEWYSYDNAGNITSRIDFKTGKAQGFAILYYPSGRIKEYGFWNNSRWVGNYELFYSNGNIHQSFVFNSDGKRIGFSKFYFMNGIISNVAFLLDGTEQISLDCDSTGKIIKTKASIDLFSMTAIKEMQDLVKSENEVTFQKNKLVEQRIEAVKKEKELALSNEEKQKQQTIIYFIGAMLLLVLLFSIFVFRGYRQKQKANDELIEKNNLIAEQKNLVEEKQREILDSIYYARRIQRSLLPTEKYIDKNLNRLKAER
jgi:antitoxin component YwqK of YwqJK toxin-antitoxin module